MINLKKIKSITYIILGIIILFTLHFYIIQTYYFEHYLQIWKITVITYSLFLILGTILFIYIQLFPQKAGRLTNSVKILHPDILLLTLILGSGIFAEIIAMISNIYAFYSPSWEDMMLMLQRNYWTLLIAAILSCIGICISGKTGYFLALLYPFVYLSLLLREVIFNKSIVISIFTSQWQIFLILAFITPVLLNLPRTLKYFGITERTQQLRCNILALLVALLSVIWIYIWRYCYLLKS